MLLHVDGQCDPGLVEQRGVDRVHGSLDALEPVAGDSRDAPVAVQVLVAEGKVGERRRLGTAEPHPREAAGLMDGEVDDGHARREPLGPGRLGRALDDAAGDVDLPAVVDAAQGVALDAGEQQRGAAVRAELVEEADAAVFGAEGDVVLAEEPYRHRRLAVHEMRRHRERDPVVLPHQATHRRVALDAGHAARSRRGSSWLGFGDAVERRAGGVGNVRLTPQLDRERHDHERVHESQEVDARRRACRRGGTCRRTRSRPGHGGRWRRRTPASPPSSSPSASPTAPARSPGTISPANGSSSANSRGSNAIAVQPFIRSSS